MVFASLGSLELLTEFCRSAACAERLDYHTFGDACCAGEMATLEEGLKGLSVGVGWKAVEAAATGC